MTISRSDGVVTSSALLPLPPIALLLSSSLELLQVLVQPVVALFQEVIDEVADNPRRIKPVERFAFYERARKAFAVIQTGERRLYGNLILKKGVLPPEEG
jgi:L-fucose mutarotase/ribose pyranase (RbsD/FucU family)